MDRVPTYLADPVNVSKPYITTETFTHQDQSSSAWISESFKGSHSRQIIDNVLTFEMQQQNATGGLDVGLSPTAFLARPVSDLPEDIRFCSAYDISLSGSGRWWAGPKISVNWQGTEAAKHNGDDWYENYIVESASSTPQTLHNIFTGDYFKGVLVSKKAIEGAAYKHYKIRFHTWWQFWSVRQTYRSEGQVPIKTLVDIWVENGLPENRQMDGIKANVETYGPLSGKGTLSSALTLDAIKPCTH